MQISLRRKYLLFSLFLTQLCCVGISFGADSSQETSSSKADKNAVSDRQHGHNKREGKGMKPSADSKANSAAESDSKKDSKEDEKDWDEHLTESKKLYAAGKLNESANELDISLASAERIKMEAPRADAYLRLGEQFLYLKQFEKAKTLMEEGLRIKRKIPGFKSVQSANSLDNLAQAYSRLGDLDSASKFELEALDNYQSMHKTDSHDYAVALSNHANTLRAQKQYKESEQFFAKAVAVQQKAEKEDGVELAKILLNAGGLYCEMNKLESAKRLLDRASKIVHAKLSPENPLFKLSVKSERVLYKKRVDALLKKDPNPIRPDVAQAVQHLASLYEAEDDYSQATAAYKQAIGIQEKLLSPDSPELKRLRDAYAACNKKISN